MLRVSGKDLEIIVAPLVGAWIEIFVKVHFVYSFEVAPLVGAWIEIAYSGMAVPCG